jgi:HD-GYP domain-containing protein (c-di-GMP phosphodiesterase class II)
MSFDVALEEIRACSGTQFDPRVVSAFQSMPIESWIAIHDSVNKLHKTQDCFDALCPSSNTYQ